MQLATMASSCFAVLVLFLIKQALGVPGDAVMFMPPLEVRTMDMNSNMLPFFNSRFFLGNQQITPQQMQQPSMPQPEMQDPPMQQSLIEQQTMQRPMMQQPSMQRPIMQQPSMQRPIMQQPSMQRPIMQQPAMQPSSMQEPSIQQSSMHESMMQLPTMQKPTILHHTSIQSTSPPIIEPVTSRPHEHRNMTFDELVEVLNEISERNKDTDDEESFEMRAAGPGYGYSAPLRPPSYSPPPSYSSYSSYPHPYVPPRPSYVSYAPSPAPAYQPSYAPPAIHHHHASKIGKSDLISSLLKPVATKVTSKVGGLIGLVLSLLGGSSGGLELGGFKTIIEGIIKPLLVAKGGIKSLISKLAIPVIALILINVEVLITVWWLWEECPEPIYSYPNPPPPPPAYHSY